MLTNSYSVSAAGPSQQRDGDDEYQPRIFAASGRIGRLRYVAYGVLVTLPYVLSYALSCALPYALPASWSLVLGMILRNIMFFLSAGLVLIQAKRRMNDLGHSSWMALLMLIPGVNLLVWLYLLCARGTGGRNQYGPKPNNNPRGMGLFALILQVQVMAGFVTLAVLLSHGMC